MNSPIRSSALQASTSVVCNLCGADDAETVFEAGAAQLNRIVKCRRCSLMYSNPRDRPVDSDLIQEYDFSQTENAEEYDPARFVKERMQVRDYADTRKYLASLYPDRGRLLELGCGMGFLLKAFSEDGWDVVGIEPDEGFCEFIQKTHGLKAIPNLLEDARIPDNSLDVVVFIHVIEHIPDPQETLRSIYRALKPGGHLVIETPRYDSLMFKLLGRRERSVSCDGHIYFFTSQTLRKLYENAGFQHRQLRYVGRSLNLDKLAYNVGLMTKSEVVIKGLIKLSHALRFDRVWLKVNARDMQRVVVQKPA